MRIKAIILIVSASLFACDSKQKSSQEVVEETIIKEKTSQVEIQKNEKVILCFGNSLTAGYGLEEEESYPSLLQDKIDSLSLDYTVVNAGISGETTADGLNRIEWVLKQDIDIFILELGANDMLRGLDVDASKSNLDGIIKKVKAKDSSIKIIIAGMIAPDNMGESYATKFNTMYKDLAKKHQCGLIPFFLKNVAGIATLNLGDGKHPNASGQKKVLNNVWLELSKII